MIKQDRPNASSSRECDTAVLIQSMLHALERIFTPDKVRVLEPFQRVDRSAWRRRAFDFMIWYCDCQLCSGPKVYSLTMMVYMGVPHTLYGRHNELAHCRW